MDEMKIESLRAIGASLRRGGHGTARRKFQKVRKQSSKADEAKFQVSRKRLCFTMQSTRNAHDSVDLSDLEKSCLAFNHGLRLGGK